MTDNEATTSTPNVQDDPEIARALFGFCDYPSPDTAIGVLRAIEYNSQNVNSGAIEGRLMSTIMAVLDVMEKLTGEPWSHVADVWQEILNKLD